MSYFYLVTWICLYDGERHQLMFDEEYKAKDFIETLEGHAKNITLKVLQSS